MKLLKLLPLLLFVIFSCSKGKILPPPPPPPPPAAVLEFNHLTGASYPNNAYKHLAVLDQGGENIYYFLATTQRVDIFSKYVKKLSSYTVETTQEIRDIEVDASGLYISSKKLSGAKSYIYKIDLTNKSIPDLAAKFEFTGYLFDIKICNNEYVVAATGSEEIISIEKDLFIGTGSFNHNTYKRTTPNNPIYRVSCSRSYIVSYGFDTKNLYTHPLTAYPYNSHDVRESVPISDTQVVVSDFGKISAYGSDDMYFSMNCSGVNCSKYNTFSVNDTTGVITNYNEEDTALNKVVLTGSIGTNTDPLLLVLRDSQYYLRHVREDFNIGVSETSTEAYRIVDVKTTGTKAYILDSRAGLIIVSNLTPEFSSTPIFETNRDSKDIFVDDNYLYVAKATDGLFIYDISELGSMTVQNQPYTLKAVFDTDVYATKVIAKGDFIFLADSWGMTIIKKEINDSNQMILSSVERYTNFTSTVGDNTLFSASGSINGMLINEDKLILSSYDGGLSILDISNPLNSSVIKRDSIINKISNMSFYENKLYFIEHDTNKLKKVYKVVDINNITNPTVTDHIDVFTSNPSGTITKLVVNASGIYVISSSQGLLKISHEAVLDTVSVSSIKEVFDFTIYNDILFVAYKKTGAGINSRTIEARKLSSLTTVASTIDSNYLTKFFIAGDRMFCAHTGGDFWFQTVKNLYDSQKVAAAE